MQKDLQPAYSVRAGICSNPHVWFMITGSGDHLSRFVKFRVLAFSGRCSLSGS